MDFAKSTQIQIGFFLLYFLSLNNISFSIKLILLFFFFFIYIFFFVDLLWMDPVWLRTNTCVRACAREERERGRELLIPLVCLQTNEVVQSAVSLQNLQTEVVGHVSPILVVFLFNHVAKHNSEVAVIIQEAVEPIIVIA